MSFYDLKPEPIVPVLILGFANGMNHPKQSWSYWWFHSAFLNEGKSVEYFDTKEGKPFPLDWKPSTDNKVVYFKSKYTDDSYTWFKDGYMFAHKLLEIKDYTKIKELAEIIVSLWKGEYSKS